MVLVGNEIAISNQRKLYENLERKITEVNNSINRKIEK